MPGHEWFGGLRPDEVQRLYDAVHTDPRDARIAELESQLAAANRRAEEKDAEAREMRAEKDGAYNERNRVVALLAALLPSTQNVTHIDGWDAEWNNCVYITLPDGTQASWHYHDRDAHLFSHVPKSSDAAWDGHTTKEKYERIEEVCAHAEREPRDSDPSDDCAKFMCGPYRPGEGCVTDGHHMCSECECNEARAEREKEAGNGTA